MAKAGDAMLAVRRLEEKVDAERRLRADDVERLQAQLKQERDARLMLESKHVIFQRGHVDLREAVQVCGRQVWRWMRQRKLVMRC
jgi:hypothetical protein